MNRAIGTAAERPREKRLRLELVKAIPRIPNDRPSLLQMQQKSLNSVLIDFIHWRARYVGIRPRRIEIEATAKADPQWSVNAAAVETLLQKAERGDDLTPHLSLAPHTRGYAPAAYIPGATNEDRWSDKDLLLTKMGYHHFHLGMRVETAGHVTRTDELIFAEVSRDQFKVVAIFSHEVFDSNSAERGRLNALHNWIVFRELPAGTGVISGPVMTSGHSMHVVTYADRCTRLIRELDPQLDDPASIRQLFASAKFDIPEKPRFKWIFMHLDLAIYESFKGTALIMQKGWN